MRPDAKADGGAATGTATARIAVPDAPAMRAIGRRLAGLLRAGDVVLLAGGLGAGKTTLTQGIGAGLRVRGPVTSPTFVIARVHPSEVGGPLLVHVDAYRLASFAEVEDLDLEASLSDAVTVVEWGEGKAEGLAEDRLEITVTRAPGGDFLGGTADDESDPRTVTVTSVGTRWSAEEITAALA